jgi:hypothetical protein
MPVARLYHCIAVLALFAAQICFAQAPDDRVAFVIGNASYPGSSALKNPRNDAHAIDAQLRQLGFETHLFLDIKSQDLDTIRQALEKRIRRNSVLFFYYAGHGVQIDGRNYLVPIDTRTGSLDQVAEDALYLGDILSSIDKKRPKLATVILDACRDNPFKNEGNVPKFSKGLARVDPPSSTVVFYATRPGGVASDGSGQNGLFTQSLLEELRRPDQLLEVILRKTSTKVYDVSKSEQEPWVEGVIRQEFLISKLPPAPTPTASPAPAPADQALEAVASSSMLTRAEEPKTLLSALDVDAISNRRRSLHTSLTKETKTSYMCDAGGCYDYAQWAKSLTDPQNLEQLNTRLSQIATSKTASVCVFNIIQDSCTDAPPKLWIIYPLVFTRPTTFRGYDLVETKVTKNGGLSFEVMPIFYAGQSRREGCFTAAGNLMFTLDQITLDVARHTCLNVIVPASIKNNFQVLYADLSKREIVVKWDLSMISVLAAGGGSEVIKITF